MVLRSEPLNLCEKREQIDMLDGCISRICVSDEPLEIVRMLGFANHYLGMLAQHRMLELTKGDVVK